MSIDVHGPIDKILAEAETRFDAKVSELGGRPTLSEAQVWRAMSAMQRVTHMFRKFGAAFGAFANALKGTP